MAEPSTQPTEPPTSWVDPDQATAYLDVADAVPHRAEGEAVLVEVLPERLDRVLDLGTGDGRTLALVRAARPGATGVAVDVSPPMLAAFRTRFADELASGEVALVAHDLHEPLPAEVVDAGPFDAVVSSFAIHHLPDERKRALYAEAFALVRPGGRFANLEHVASPTPALHQAFEDALASAMGDLADAGDDDDVLAPVPDQLDWLRDAGFDDVDCLWRWRELALLVGTRPAG